MPLSKVDTRGQYTNRITDEDANRGCRGKLDHELLAKRVELHAERRIHGSPTVNQITQYWYDKHGISINPQTEKDWALRTSNKEAIECKVDELLKSGKGQIASISDQALVNTLAIGAKENAKIVKETGAVVRSLLKDFLVKDDKEQSKTVSLLKGLSQVTKVHAESLTEMVKLATQTNKTAALTDQEIRRQAKMIANAHDLERAKREDDKKLSEIIHGDSKEVEDAIELLEKEHADK